MFLEEFHRVLITIGVQPSAARMLQANVRKAYSHPSRHYHDLRHLDNLHAQLLPVRDRLEDPDAVILAIAYHDAVYDVKHSDNEERSAELARKSLEPLGINQNIIDHTATMILATKTHALSEDNDLNLFTDADLSILGSSPEDYVRYAEQVRREYGIYPDIFYRPGRRNVLTHFLAMPRIFKTEHFHRLFEEQARVNLRVELDRLG